MMAARTAVFGLAVLMTSAAGAADLDVYRERVVPLPDGVPCESAVTQTFPSIWRGHVSGGQSYYPGPGSSVALDWRDETLCFPSHRTCSRFVSGVRRAFHRPEGYFTCLPIR